MKTPSRALLNSINKLRECFAGTTAALAPYPVGVIGDKRKYFVKKRSDECYSIERADGSVIKQFWKTEEAAQQVCDELNRKLDEKT